MYLAAVADERTCTWLKMAGVSETHPVLNPADAFEPLKALMKRIDVAVIIITPEVARANTKLVQESRITTGRRIRFRTTSSYIVCLRCRIQSLNNYFPFNMRGYPSQVKGAGFRFLSSSRTRVQIPSLALTPFTIIS